jgi:hypothetical protein
LSYSSAVGADRSNCTRTRLASKRCGKCPAACSSIQSAVNRWDRSSRDSDSPVELPILRRGVDSSSAAPRSSSSQKSSLW